MGDTPGKKDAPHKAHNPQKDNQNQTRDKKEDHARKKRKPPHARQTQKREDKEKHHKAKDAIFKGQADWQGDLVLQVRPVVFRHHWLSG